MGCSVGMMMTERRPWTEQDEKRIAKLRRSAPLTPAEKFELRELRMRETVEAFQRRRVFYGKKRTDSNQEEES